MQGIQLATKGSWNPKQNHPSGNFHLAMHRFPFFLGFTHSPSKTYSYDMFFFSIHMFLLLRLLVPFIFSGLSVLLTCQGLELEGLAFPSPAGSKKHEVGRLVFDRENMGPWNGETNGNHLLVCVCVRVSILSRSSVICFAVKEFRLY